ncbi:MAG: hypothetical protein ACE5D8_00350 [Fidelibacterota bacterium]
MKGGMFLTCLLGLLMGQVDWFGYLESEFDRFALNDKTYHFGYHKLRLDMETRPAETVLVAANLNLHQYVGQTHWNFLDFIPPRYWNIILFAPGNDSAMSINPEIPYDYRDTLYLDNAYLRAAFPAVDLIVGKQPLSLGTGYAWNPVDIFNKKDPVDPTYEQTGIQALRFDVPLTSRGGLTLVVTPAATWQEATRYVQVKAGLASFDITLNAAKYMSLYRYWDYVTYSGRLPTKTEYTAYGGTFVGQVLGVGIWGETWQKKHTVVSGKTFRETILGFDYTFENGFMVLSEFLFNEQGAATNNLSLNDYFAYFSGETHSLMQHYQFLYASYPVSDFVRAGFLSIINYDDISAMISPQVDWDIFENGTLSIWYTFPYGNKETEFGYQEDGWRIRLRSYF